MVKDDFQDNSQVDEGGKIIVEKTKKKKFKFTKKTMFTIVGVLVVTVLVGVGIFISQRGKDNFHTLTKGAYGSMKGQFTYTFDVRTQKHTENTDVQIDYEEIKDVESGEEASTSENYNPEDEVTSSDKTTSQDGLEGVIGGATDKQATDNVEWNNAEGIKTGYWQYPNYRITFTGCVNDVEKPESKVKVSIATDYYNGDFTEIIELNGKTYLNIGLMKTWLTNSGDAYLVSLAGNLPDGTYVSYENLDFESRYADNPEATKYSGYTNFVTRNVKLINGIYSQITDSIGNTGLSRVDDDFYSIELTEKEEMKLAKAVRGVVLGTGNIYDGYISSLELSDEAKAEASNSKKNVLNGFNDLISYFNSADLNEMNMRFSGKANKYVGTDGTTSIDSNFGISFTMDDVDYVIKANLSRIAKAGEVTEPLDTVVEFSGDESIRTTVRNVVDYFNPINKVDLACDSVVTNEEIKQDALKGFAKLVNERGTYDKYLSELNILAYIEEFMNGDVSDENTKLVNEFMQTFNGLTGGLIIEKEVQQEVVEEQYPNIEGKLVDKIKIMHGSYVEEGSSKGLIHVQLFIINKDKYERPLTEGSEVTLTPYALDLTKFSVTDAKNTKTNANNEVLLRAFDNNWDMTKSPTTVYLNPEGFTTIDLYFTADDFVDKVELFYDGEKLGTVKAY